MNRLSRVLVLSSALLALPSAAHALGSYGVGASLGQGAAIAGGEFSRSPVNIELVPCYSLTVFRAELGIVSDLEVPEGADRQFLLRPGVTFNPPVIPFYARVAAAAPDDGRF